MTRARGALALLVAVAIGAVAGGCRGRTVVVLVGPDAGPGASDAGPDGVDAGPGPQDAGPDPRDGGPIDTCARAFLEGRDGSPCVPLDRERCVLERGCCRFVAVCESGTLFRFRDCSACPACASDRDCATREWCVEDRCVPCAEPDPPPTCPAPLVPFQRNGCATAVCLPPSRCSTDDDCLGALRVCAPGAACACRGDPADCCVNVCAPADCNPGAPAPEGCIRPCTDVRCPTGHCWNFGCRCEPDGWRCEERCAPVARATC